MNATFRFLIFFLLQNSYKRDKECLLALLEGWLSVPQQTLSEVWSLRHCLVTALPPQDCSSLRCNPGANCVDSTETGPRCQCIPGFIGDGTICTPNAEGRNVRFYLQIEIGFLSINKQHDVTAWQVMLCLLWNFFLSI